MEDKYCTEDYNDIKENMRIRLLQVRNDISSALKQSGRSEDSLTLIGVSKYFPAEYARAACELGLLDLGENRVQELLSKEEELESLGIHPKWHLIGTLQTNKVRSIIGHTSLIHSVSSGELLMEIQKRSQAKDLITPVLLQINVSKEESKHGFPVEEMERIAELAGTCTHISLRGLMTMAPVQIAEHDALPVFQKTKEIFDKLKNQVRNPQEWSALSMGMSQDYIDAIQCGATHIRIGTAIFGHRNY